MLLRRSSDSAAERPATVFKLPNDEEWLVSCVLITVVVVVNNIHHY